MISLIKWLIFGHLHEWEILAASSIYEDQTTERPCGSRVILRCKHCGDVKQKKMMS